MKINKIAIKDITAIATPLLLNNIITAISGFAGVIFIAQLGGFVLPAAAIAFVISGLVTLIGFGMTQAVGILISEEYGAQRHQNVGDILQQAFILLVTTGGIIMLIMHHLAPLLLYFGQEKSLLPTVDTLLKSLSWPVIPTLLYALLKQYIIATGRPKIISYCSVLSLMFSLFFFYVLIFGKYGFPAFGVEGLGLGYTLSYSILTTILICCMALSQHSKLFKVRLTLPAHLYYIKKIIALGVPMSIQYSSEMGALTIGTFIIGTFGTFALSAQEISDQVLYACLMCPMGISQAVSVTIAKARGEQNTLMIRQYFNNGILLGAILALILAVVITLIPEQIISIYIAMNHATSPEVIKLAKYFLYVTVISQFMDSLRNIITGALRGLEDTTSPMYISLILLWAVGLPVGFTLTFFVGAIGVNLGLLVAFTLSVLILFRRMTVHYTAAHYT